MSGRPHPPSQMRALLQDWKHGQAARTLLGRARAIEDPSFVAEALFALATDASLDESESTQVALESLRFLDKVEREWRRAEAMTAMAKRLGDLRRSHAEAARQAGAGIVDRILGLPAKARAEAMRAAAGQLDAEALPRLMARALASEEDALETGKAILRAAVDAGAATAVLPPIQDCLEPELRLRMLGAWASRMAASQPGEASRVLESLLQGIGAMPPDVRLDILRAFIAATDTVAALHVVHTFARSQDDEMAARLLAALGARADRLAQRGVAEILLKEAAARAATIADEKARASVQRNVQEGLKRAGLLEAGMQDGAPRASDAAVPSSVPLSSSTTPSTRISSSSPQAHAEAPNASTRHVLALVDTYEGGLGDVHLRAVARAAPLCDAFGFDLALVGFPIKDAAAFVKRAARETNIGEGRKSLESLFRQGRLHLVPVPGDAPPDMSQLGLPVATTPNPDPKKATSDFPGETKLCVLMGLGPSGLPETMLRSATIHVELTGQGISLETATAMGVVAERMRGLTASVSHARS